MKQTKTTQRRPLALCLALALAAPAVAPAQETADGDASLEARIAQLERMVAALKGELEAQKAAQAEQAAKAPDPAKGIQQTPIMPAANPGTRFSFGGFIKLDSLYTRSNGGEIPDGSAGRLFYLPGAIPVGGADEGTDLDVHAQFSRLWFGADTDLDGHKLRAYLEMDLFGGALGNEIATNTYGVTIRHAYVAWDKWLAGQTWSNFQDVAALPDAVDFIGPTEGTIFVRQAQLRYSNGPWSVSLENPETTFTGHLNGVRGNSDDNNVPDLSLRYTHKADWGHFGIAGLVRQLKVETPAASESETAFGLSLSGKVNLGSNDDLRFMLSGGSGLGRYLGLGLGPDAMVAADGSLEALDAYGGFVAWRHVFSPKLRGNLFYSAASYDNDPALTGLGVTKSSQSIHANLIWTVLPKLEVGAELIRGTRELESGAEGDLDRLHMHVKYSF